MSQTLARVIEREPDWDALPAAVPPRVRQTLRACLQKDPRQRLGDVQDIRLVLAGAFETVAAESSAHPAEVADVRPRWRRAAPAVAAAAAAALLAGVAVWVVMRVEPAALTRFEITTPADARPGTNTYPDLAISPDGTHIVYASGSASGTAQLWVRRTDELEATLLRGAESGADDPFFSPDGQRVGFTDFTQAALKWVPILGGPATTISSAPAGAFQFAGASWGPDDTIVFGTANGGLWRVPAAGGEPEPLTTVEPGEAVNHGLPDVLPNSTGALFTLWGGSVADSRIGVVSFETGAVTELVAGGSDPLYVASGHIVYAIDGTLRAVPFEQDSLELGGSPVPVVEDVVVKGSGSADFAVADDATLVYLQGASQGGAARTLVWVDRSGREDPIDLPPRGYQWVRVSPDGSRFAVEMDDGDIWVSSVARPGLSRVTVDSADDFSPLWTPDGQRIVSVR